MASGYRTLFRIFILLVFVNTIYCKSGVVELDENNWQKILTGEWMVEFYAPWCPACKALQPVWRDFGFLSEDLDINVGLVDVTSSPGLSGRFLITALPTIFHVLDGEFRQYRGGRDKDSFVTFIEEKKWKSVEPIPYWKSPPAVTMSIVSYFFKISQVLRTVHAKFMDEYGLPAYASYVIFALVTIMFGAVLGLVLVCVIDLLHPPKPPAPPAQESKKDDKENDEEEDEEVEEVSREDLEDEESSNEAESHNESETEEGKGEGGEGSSGVRKRKPRKVD